MKILVIRPEPGASATAARAKAAGFEPILLPFYEVRPRRWTVADPSIYDALLVTSANAIRHGGDLPKLPVCAVGERSAGAARAAGLTVAVTGNVDADAAIAEAAKAGFHRLLWLAGAEHKQPAIPAGVSLDTIICYVSDALPLPPDAAKNIGEADVVALHSPRAARHFGAVAEKLRIPKTALAIAAFSPTIAKAAGQGWRAVAIAAQPKDSALLSAIGLLAKQQFITANKKDSQ